MGLAPYGNPKYVEALSKLIILKPEAGYELNLKYFKHHKSNILLEWSGGTPIIDQLYSEQLPLLLGKARLPNEELTQKHFDIAHSVQKVYENILFKMLDSLYEKTRLPDLALAGGCALNSVANGEIVQNSKFENVYIQSAAGDAGGAIGAALVTIKENSTAKDCDVGPFKHHNHSYWGPSYSNEHISEMFSNAENLCSSEDIRVEYIPDFENIIDQTARAIGEGKVIGWFQGKMEWGPRALGNRSILCDPRRKDMKDILNIKIKRRESFRPFAPSILREHVSQWFEHDTDVPFMMQVLQIKEEMRHKIPAVTHVDGSGRLQTVDLETNERYYLLIDKFRQITGIPMLLNTSFNENEPVVCSPKEAYSTFLRTKMDLLVMNNWLVERIHNSDAS